MRPLMLGTWSFGQLATRAGWPLLRAGQPDVLGAVEAGCRAVEAEAGCRTVGRGGLPDCWGRVTLDAAVMLGPRQSGAVAGLGNAVHAVSVARAVMERTPHRLLVGDGAERFAEQEGLSGGQLLTDSGRAMYERWRRRYGRRPAGPEDFSSVRDLEERLSGPGEESGTEEEQPWHDTVCVLAVDASGRLAGAGSTSGWPFKMPGRVGDTPIIGHGLYVEPGVGAACATGAGELISSVCASFLAVEHLRGGMTGLEALTAVLERIVRVHRPGANVQVAMAVLLPDGRFATASLRGGYCTAVRSDRADKLIRSHRVLLGD